MTIVIDASVCVAALIDAGETGQWAEEILFSDQVVAPNLLSVETTNVLRRLCIAGKITEQEAHAAQQDFLSLSMDFYTFEPVADRVWELRANLTSYDAFYVALAETLNAPVVTLDQQLVNSPGTKCKFLTSPEH